MKSQERELASSLANGFSLEKWIEAETSARGVVPQPKGSITVEQYADMRGVSSVRARVLLNGLRKSGLAFSKRWSDGNSGVRNVYWLKPKSEWPKK